MAKAAAPRPQSQRGEEGKLARHSGHHGLVIASNRLPVRLSLSDGGIDVARSSGGLAVALEAVRGESTWVGWPGTVVPPEYERRVAQRLARDHLAPSF